jgi:hypothetical protein
MNWLHTYWFSYEWPSIKGNGPEDATSLLVVGILTGIFVPRVRRWWIAREQSVHAKLDHVMRQNAHLIHHSKSTPDVAHDGVNLTADHNGNPLVQPSETK